MKDFPEILMQSVLRPGGVIILGTTESLYIEEREALERRLAMLFPDCGGLVLLPSKVPCLFIINVEKGAPDAL